MRIADKVFFAALLLAAGCFAQTTRPQARDITLLEGRGELLTFQTDITKLPSPSQGCRRRRDFTA